MICLFQEVGEMNKLAEKKLLRHVDREMYDTKGFVDYHELQKHLHVKVKTLAGAINKTPRALEKNPNSESTQKELRKIVYILSLLKEMLASESEILIWLKAPNTDFDGLSPMDVIARGDTDAVSDYLMHIRKGSLA